MDQNALNASNCTHSRSLLSLNQLNAIDLLLSGADDADVAARLEVHRTTVVRWRIHNPYFQAALHKRREEVWRGARDATRLVLPAALETMRDQLRVAPQRGRLALEILRSAGLFGAPYTGALGTVDIGPTDPNEIIDAEVRRRRTLTPTAVASPSPYGDDDYDPLVPTPLVPLNPDPPVTTAERETVIADLLAQSEADPNS